MVSSTHSTSSMSCSSTCDTRGLNQSGTAASLKRPAQSEYECKEALNKLVPTTFFTFLPQEDFGKDWAKSVRNALDILRLKSAQSETPTAFCNITALVPKDISPASLREISQDVQIDSKGQILLPCVNIPPMTEAEKALTIRIENVGQTGKTKIVCNLELGDLSRLHKSSDLPDGLLQNLSQLSVNTTTASTDSLGKNQSTENTNKLSYLPPNLEWMRNAVTALSFEGGLTLQDLDQLAQYFPNIKQLSLSGYKGVNEMVEHLKGFSKLEALDLSRTDVTGRTFNQLPKSMKALKCDWCKNLLDEGLGYLSETSLENLDVSFTNIKGTTFGKFPKTLKAFKCSACHNLCDEVFAQLSHTQLEYLDMQVLDIFGMTLHQLPATLQYLRLDACHNLNDNSLEHLSHSQLKLLYLNNTEILGTSFASLPKTLKFLSCAECYQLKEEAIKNLAQIELETLILRIIPLKGTFFNFLPKSIQFLDCDFTDVDDESVGKISCPRLAFLDISGTAIQGTTLRNLSQSLKLINIDSCLKLQKEAHDVLSERKVEIMVDEKGVIPNAPHRYPQMIMQNVFEKLDPKSLSANLIQILH